MTVTATLERNNVTVDLPILAEGGDLAIARDFGKPNLRMQTNGRIDPRSMDQWAGQQSLNIYGQFIGESAYTGVRKLSNFIKSSTAGRDTTLSIPLDRYPDSMLVAPSAGQDVALSVEYPPGQRNWVPYELTLSRVSQIVGSGSMQARTPTAIGSGPVELSGPTNTIELTTDISFTREVGRPNSETTKSTNSYPTYTEHQRSAFDAWSLGFEEIDNADQITQQMAQMFSQQLGRDSLTLDFNGIFGLGSFNVIPQGSQAMRQVESVGESGVMEFPTVNLRVVENG